jgi:ABC-type Fe3+/spermidine/putrescine transport system ATPase subunit
MIKIDSISKSFGEKRVLGKLSLDVKENEILSLLGPNACGKTTLLNILSGLTKPDEGNVYLNDVLVNGNAGTKKIYIKPSDRKVGYVLQTISLFPHMRAKDNVAYGLKALHLSRQEVEKRTIDLIDFVGLREYAKLYPSQLSGGQKQRVALARSLATEPKILLLDEPVSAVDPQLRESFRLELKNYLRLLKITVIYVTHNLSEAFIMSDRIAVMGNGRIEQIGSGADLFDKPNSWYVAKFLGVNSFEGKATKTRCGLMEIETNGSLVLSPLTPNLLGKKVIVTIKPENITITKTADIEIQNDKVNFLESIVTEMVQMRSNAQVTVDAGFVLRTRLPLSAIKHLGLMVGDRVYVYFNAEALNVFADESN